MSMPLLYPEIIFADSAIKASFINDSANFINVMQSLQAFGVTVSQKANISSPEDLTSDQCEWFVRYQELFSKIAALGLYESFVDDLMAWEESKNIDLSFWETIDSSDLTDFTLDYISYYA